MTTSEKETSVMSSSSTSHSPSTLSWTYEDFVLSKKEHVQFFRDLDLWIRSCCLCGEICALCWFLQNELLLAASQFLWKDKLYECCVGFTDSIIMHIVTTNIILDISTTMTTITPNKPFSMSRSSKRKPSRGIKWGKVYSSMGIACFPDKKWGHILHLNWCWTWWWLLQVRTTIRTIWSTFHPLGTCSVVTLHSSPNFNYFFFFQNNTLSSPRSCALRALGLLRADGAPTVGRGKTFWWVN